LKVKYKILFVVILSILLLSVGVGYFSQQKMHDEVIKAAQEKLMSDLSLGRSYLNEKYPGDWEIKDEKLYKGNSLMNDDFTITDELGDITGDTVTIFQGNTRISTNVKDENGKRAVGTTVSETVANIVLVQGERFVGKANVVGIWNQTAYEPIKNSVGENIGIWYVGVPNVYYDNLVLNYTKNISLIIIIGLIFILSITTIVLTILLKPLNVLEKATHKIAEGDFTNTVEIKTKDEFGKLAIAFNSMTSDIRKILVKVTETSNHVSEL
jgi:methyl-accepting chemotaxis protein